MVSDTPARKLEYLSSTHYHALAWSRGALQVQLARHDPTTELNAWLSSLDVRNRTGDFTVDAVGFQVWNYNTNGLDVSIYRVPTWSILVVTLAMLTFFSVGRKCVLRDGQWQSCSLIVQTAKL